MSSLSHHITRGAQAADKTSGVYYNLYEISSIVWQPNSYIQGNLASAYAEAFMFDIENMGQNDHKNLCAHFFTYERFHHHAILRHSDVFRLKWRDSKNAQGCKSAHNNFCDHWDPYFQ